LARWLFKEEPDHYSYNDLARDKKTTWAGVNNALARKHLRQVQAGDRVFFYHTGKEKAIVGEMRVVAGPAADADSDDPAAVVVEVEPVRALKRPVTLAQIKADETFSDWELVRMPRLSVMPVTEAQWRRVEELGRADG
jgi:predicted RNA-binding protein with PUA-like domain